MSTTVGVPNNNIRVAPRTLASLLVGRGTFRAAQYGSALALLTIWGEQRYGHFAAALGGFLWLTALTSVGTEKAALKLLARARRTHDAILGAFLFVACAVQIPALAVFGFAVLAGWPEPAALYAGGAAFAASLGANVLLVGLLRVTGRPGGDVANFLLLSATYVVLTALARPIGPVAYLGGQLAVLTVINVAIVRRLGPPSLAIGRRLGRVVGRCVGLMSGTELCAQAAPSILFIELAASRWADQSGWLYLADLVWAAALNLFFYLLRVYQPRTAARLAGPGARRGRVAARRLAGLAVAWSVLWLTVALAVLDPAGLPLLVVLGLLLAVRAPGFALVNLAGYLLENGDDRSLRTGAVAAVGGLVALAIAGLVAIPAIGAAGAPVALGVMDLAQAVVLYGLINNRRPLETLP